MVVKLLLERGGDPDYEDSDGRTPLSWAAGAGREQVIHLLLAAGVDRDRKDKVGRTPLAHAAKAGRAAVVKLLISEGADHDTKDWCGRVPMLWTAAAGYPEVVSLLCSITNDPNAKDQHGRTPLMAAAARGCVPSVRVLLAVDGIDRDCKDNFSRPAFSEADQRGHNLISKLLLSDNVAGPAGCDDLNLTPCQIDCPQGVRCDICLLIIPLLKVHLHCQICDHGDFDICSECFECGARCFNANHVLVRRKLRRAPM